MKKRKHVYYFFILIFTLTIFNSSFSQEFLISEFLPINTLYPDESGEFYPAIEILNTSHDTLNLSDYFITGNLSFQEIIEFPNQNLAGGELKFFWLSGKSGESHTMKSWTQSESPIFLVKKNDGVLQDSITDLNYEPNESICLNPDFPSERFYATSENLVSLGKINPSPGPWRKIQSRPGFTPSDSGFRGAVEHDGKMWILNYEDRDSLFIWHGITKVWNSVDGINWNLINETPPYAHGALYCTFKDYIWVYQYDTAFRSQDGINWEGVKTNKKIGGRAAILNDQLWVMRGDSLLSSENGIDWTIKRKVPWPFRPDPVFMEHNGQLWTFGGGINYSTYEFEYYYRDVWKSNDGTNWEMVTETAPWDGGIWTTYKSFDDKIWLFGGYNYWNEYTQSRTNDPLQIEFGNSNEIWFTTDGKDWTKLEVDNIWARRHAQFTWAYNNSLWVVGGFGGGPSTRFRHDVWKFTKLNRPIEISINNAIIIDSQLYYETYYGGQPITYNIKSDLLYEITNSDGTTITIDSLNLKIINAGESQIVITQAGNEIYNSDKKIINIKVNKAQLFVKPRDYSRLVFEQNPQLEYDIWGFVLEDNKESIDTLPELETDANAFSPQGTYSILSLGGIDRNYDFIHEEGKLEVLKIKENEIAMNVFPVPANNQLKVLLDEKLEALTFEIRDLNGSIVSSSNSQNDNYFEFNISTLPAGVYMLKVIPHSGKRVAPSKFIKLN